MSNKRKPKPSLPSHHSSLITFFFLFLFGRAGERRDVAAEEGVVEFARVVEVTLIDQHKRARRGGGDRAAPPPGGPATRPPFCWRIPAPISASAGEPMLCSGTKRASLWS